MLMLTSDLTELSLQSSSVLICHDHTLILLALAVPKFCVGSTQVLSLGPLSPQPPV